MLTALVESTPLTSQNILIEVELIVLMSIRSTMWPPNNVDFAMDMSGENDEMYC